MLVFSEGVPRSGKSYDAVKHHILPALKKGRKVFARLNGLHHDRIAVYLGIPADEVRRLLVHVPSDQVKETFVAQQDEAGEWSIADDLKNALIVIDEAHDFYVADRSVPMSKESEQFFALHGHYGCDVLLMTQFYKRVHVAIRARIERKNSFQKLSALGKHGESKYRVKYWQTVSPDKYEQVGGETKSYDASIYPLYHGIAAGEGGGVTQEVYGGGRTSVWRSMLLRAVFIVPLGILAVWFLLDFFTGGGFAAEKPSEAAPVVVSQPSAVQTGQGMPGSAVALPAPTAAQLREAKLAEMTPEQRYIWGLGEKARIRLAAVWESSAGAGAIVEWVDGSSIVIERLRLTQIQDLGVKVSVHDYGVKLVANGEALVATSWPMNTPLRDERPRLYDTGGGQSRVEQSEPRDAAAGVGQGTGLIAYDGPFPAGGAIR